MKICHFSDTRGLHSKIVMKDMLKCDMVIYSGNTTANGYEVEFTDFINWFMDIPVAHKVLIAGNRDYCLQVKKSQTIDILNKFTSLAGNHYLQETSCKIEGYNIYGSPYSQLIPYQKDVTEYGDNHFVTYDEAAAFQKWDKIPYDTHILITNVPPYDILDEGISSKHIGLMQLRDKVESLSDLKLHCFGRAFNNGIHDTFNTKFSNGNVLLNKDKVYYRPNIFEID